MSLQTIYCLQRVKNCPSPAKAGAQVCLRRDAELGPPLSMEIPFGAREKGLWLSTGQHSRSSRRGLCDKEILLTANFRLPGTLNGVCIERPGPIISLHQQVTINWIAASAGTTGFEEFSNIETQELAGVSGHFSSRGRTSHSASRFSPAAG